MLDFISKENKKSKNILLIQNSATLIRGSGFFVGEIQIKNLLIYKKAAKLNIIVSFILDIRTEHEEV